MGRELRRLVELNGTVLHWVKVKGHSADVINDKADELATVGMNGADQQGRTRKPRQLKYMHRTEGVSDRKTAQTDGQAHGLKEWGGAANLWRAGWGRSSMRGEFVASNSRQIAPARQGLAAHSV